MIAELKDEAYTQWASGWLAFQRRASRAFLDLEFNIQLSDEEVEGSASEAEVDAGVEVFSGAPDHAPVPGDPRVPPGASPSASLTRAPPFDSSTSASWGPTSGFYALSFFLFFLTLSYPGADLGLFVLLLILNFC